MYILLPILFLPAVALFVHAQRIFFGMRKEQEKRYALLSDSVAKYAANKNYSILQADMFSALGLRRIRRFLPPGLPTYNGKPVIPMYYPDKETASMWRPAYILRQIRKGREVRMFIVPTSRRRDGQFEGVVFVAGEIPATNHWVKLYREDQIFESGTDHDLESNDFNRRYLLTGSDPKLLTEVFDPLLIERLNNKSGRYYLGRIRSGVVEFAEAGVLQPALLDEVMELFAAMEVRFLKAYQSHPEPLKK